MIEHRLNRISVRTALALIVTGWLSAVALAQDPAKDYPNRPIKLIMPNAPGSSIDTLGRILGTRLGDTLGQSIVIENRAGASGVLGMELGKASAPDGYTLIVASSSASTIAPHIQKKVPFDTLADFAFISTFAVMPNVLVVHPQLPINTVRELIDYAKAHPGKVHMASAGPGAASHLAGVALMSAAGFDSLHVPYKGGGPSIASVVAGESHWTLAPAPAAMGVVRNGRLRAIGHSLDKRHPLFGDMPTLSETVPGYDYSGWAGMLAPKGTPQPIMQKVFDALKSATQDAKVREAMGAQGADVTLIAFDDFRKFVERDLANNARIVKAAGMTRE